MQITPRCRWGDTNGLRPCAPGSFSRRKHGAGGRRTAQWTTRQPAPDATPLYVRGKKERKIPRTRRCLVGSRAVRAQTLPARLDPCRAAGTGVRGVLEGVVEWIELDAKRQLEQAVRQPYVLRQERAVKIGADHVAAVDALEAVL